MKASITMDGKGEPSERMEEAVRRAEHLCPLHLAHLDRIRWKARFIESALSACIEASPVQPVSMMEKEGEAGVTVALTNEEAAFVLNELRSQGHGSSKDDFEPECPSCTAADKLADGAALLEPLDKLRRCKLGCFDYGQCKANMHGVPSECAAGGQAERAAFAEWPRTLITENAAPLWFLRVRRPIGWGAWTQCDAATVEDFRKNVTQPVYEVRQFVPVDGVWACLRGCPARETCKAIHGDGQCTAGVSESRHQDASQNTPIDPK